MHTVYHTDTVTILSLNGIVQPTWSLLYLLGTTTVFTKVIDFTFFFLLQNYRSPALKIAWLRMEIMTHTGKSHRLLLPLIKKAIMFGQTSLNCTIQVFVRISLNFNIKVFFVVYLQYSPKFKKNTTGMWDGTWYYYEVSHYRFDCRVTKLRWIL